MEEEDTLKSKEEESPVKVSYLPSWVLRMRSKIEDSRQVHSDAESRLSQISIDVNSLSAKLDSLRKDDSARQKTKAAQADNSAGRVYSYQHSSDKKSTMKIALMPPDALNIFLQYLSLSSVYGMLSSSKEIRVGILNNPYWVHLYRNKYSFLKIDASQIAYPHSNAAPLNLFSSLGTLIYEDICIHITAYLQHRARCIHLLHNLKEQRSVPKHNTVQPRRYSRADATVTHPLPLFSTGSTKSVNHNDYVMSHAETLNSDFRTIAHSTLQIIIQLTFELIDEFCVRIMQEGVVTILVSLLSNEEASIQNYACHILANLLYWDTCQSASQGVADQLTACQGHRQLCQLLTSPSASVNLTLPKANTNLLQESDKVSRKTTANVQGVCNKHASRALVCLYSPPHNVIALPSPQPSSISVLPSPQLLPYTFTYFHKSGSMKDSFVMQLEIGGEGGKVIDGDGEDSIGMFTLRGHIERDIVGYVVILHKTYHRHDSNSQRVSGSTGAHVSHVAYLASGDYSHQYSSKHSSGLQMYPTLGFWGVWETNSGQSHFDLQKGGVFRAVPLF